MTELEVYKVIKKCGECGGEEKIECSHESHYISTYSSCYNPDCDGKYIPCPSCDHGWVAKMKDCDKDESLCLCCHLRECQVPRGTSEEIKEAICFMVTQK